jgi:hypothetical protein
MLKRIKNGTISKEIGGFNPAYYPSELLWSISKIEGLDQSGNLRKYRLFYTKNLHDELKKSNFFLLHPKIHASDKQFGENTQSRLVLGLANLLKVTNSPLVKELVSKTFLALDSLPKLNVTSSVTKRKYKLPAYLYRNTRTPEAISGRSLDPNHEATLAAAYWMISDSKILDKVASNRAKAMAKYYFFAALDLAKSGRCLPLADQPDYIDSCDTRYNAFWMYWMLKMQPELGSSISLDQLRGQYRVMSKNIKNFTSERIYPLKYQGIYPDPVEIITLLPAVQQFGSEYDLNKYIYRANAYYNFNSKKSPDWPITYLLP